MTLLRLQFIRRPNTFCKCRNSITNIKRHSSGQREGSGSLFWHSLTLGQSVDSDCCQSHALLPWTLVHGPGTARNNISARDDFLIGATDSPTGAEAHHRRTECGRGTCTVGVTESVDVVQIPLWRRSGTCPRNWRILLGVRLK